MNRYSERIINKIKNNLISKKVITILLILSLSFSMVSWQNFLSIFAAVATYGRTDDGVWAYKVLDDVTRTISIRPSDLGALKETDIKIPTSIEIQGESYTVTEVAPYAYSVCFCPDCLRNARMSLSTAWEDENQNYDGEEVDVKIGELFIPITVTEIGISAFEYTSLSNVTFEKNSNLENIGEYAFGDCTLKTIEIPASVTTIESGAFSYSSIQTVNFEDGTQIEEISDYVFEESRLKTIALPETITRIGESAFLACRLTEITIPASVTNIAAQAFAENKRLKDVKFADDSALKRIRKGAFMNCSFTEVTIPSTVTTIGLCAFGNTNDLQTVTFKTNSQITDLNTNAFVKVPGYTYDEDDFEEMTYEKNTNVTQVNVENYDVYQWLVNQEIFSENTNIYSAKTRVFWDKQKEENVKDNVTMKSDSKTTIKLDEYISPKQGYHFEDSKFEYVDTLGLDTIKTGDIKETEFVSYGYPFVVIKANEKANKYEIAYDTNGSDTKIENTKCKYDDAITISSIIPSRIGYEFKGWSKNTLGEGKLYQPGEIVHENFTDKDGDVVTLYAVWEEITKKVTINFSTPKKKSKAYGYEIVITRNAKTIQQHDVVSTEVGSKEIIIYGARIGETYLIKCTNYEKSNGKKKYFKTTTKEVIIQ